MNCLASIPPELNVPQPGLALADQCSPTNDAFEGGEGILGFLPPEQSFPYPQFYQ